MIAGRVSNARFAARRLRLPGALRVLCALCLLALCAGMAPATAAIPDGDLDLAALRGKVVYVDFWASWCAPCRRSFPWMDEMQRQFGPDGLVIIAVNVDQDRADARQFLQQYSPSFAVRFDPEGALAERFKVAGMPTSFLIDRDGRVSLRHAGFRVADRETLEQQIQTLLATH